MKRSIRVGMFETNSSSVHALIMCNKEDYQAWCRGELLYSSWERELVPVANVEDEDFPYPDDYDVYDKRYLTEPEFWERECEYFDIFRSEFTSLHGDTVIAFGYYGHD